MIFEEVDFASHWRLDKINPYQLIIDMLDILEIVNPEDKLISVRIDRPYRQVIEYLQQKIAKALYKKNTYCFNGNIRNTNSYYAKPFVLNRYAFELVGDKNPHLKLIVQKEYFFLTTLKINLNKMYGLEKINKPFHDILMYGFKYLRYKLNLNPKKDDNYKSVNYKILKGLIDSFKHKYVIEKKVIAELSIFIEFAKNNSFNVEALSFDVEIQQTYYFDVFTITDIPYKNSNFRYLFIHKIINRKKDLIFSDERIYDFNRSIWGLEKYLASKSFNNYGKKNNFKL